MNSLKHGLAGEGIVLPDEERATVEERVQQWNSSLRPFTVFDLFLVEIVATESVRVERCRVLDAAGREEAALRAGESWEQDRILDAARLSTRLSSCPEVVALELATTTQGIDLLVERWRALGAGLEIKPWNDAQRSIALDLLGVSRAMRALPTPLDAAILRPEGLAGLVTERIEGLLALKPTLDAHDGREQASAMLGHTSPSVELNRLRRYEAACLRRLQWAYSRLKSAPPARSQSPHNPILPQYPPDSSSSPLLVNGRLADSLDEPFVEETINSVVDRPLFDDQVLNITVGSPQATPSSQNPSARSNR